MDGRPVEELIGWVRCTEYPLVDDHDLNHWHYEACDGGYCCLRSDIRSYDRAEVDDLAAWLEATLGEQPEIEPARNDEKWEVIWNGRTDSVFGPSIRDALVAAVRAIHRGKSGPPIFGRITS